MSDRASRPKQVRFVDVTAQAELPSWLKEEPGSAELPIGNDNRVRTLHPPELTHEKTYKLAPLLESLLPPAPPPVAATTQEQPFDSDPDLSLPPLPDIALGRKPDTLIEQLIPRAEEEAVTQIVAAVAKFATERQLQMVAAEDELVALVRVVCERVISRELELDPSICQALVHEGLAALGEADQISIRLGPFFADAVHELQFDLNEKGIEASVRIDSGIGIHGCMIETELGHVDESIQERLDKLLGSLSPEGPVSR